MGNSANEAQAPAGRAEHFRAAAFRPDGAVLALDVGSASVACGLAAPSAAGPVLLAAESAPSFGLRDGEIVDVKRAGEAIRTAVEAVSARTGVRARQAMVSFSGPARLSLARATLALPGAPRAVKPSDLEALRKSLYADTGPGWRVVLRCDGPYSVGELAGVERPVGLIGSGLTMNASFLSAPAEALAHLEAALRCAGVVPRRLLAAAWCASLGALSSDERQLGVAVLDFGAGAFRAALWEGGRMRQLYLSNAQRPTGLAGSPAPGGMEGIALAVARHFRLAPSATRRLIRQHGQVGSASGALGPESLAVTSVDGIGTRQVPLGELAATFEEFLSPAVRALRDGLSSFSPAHAGGVVLTGQGARLAGLAGLVSRHFGGVPVRVADARWQTLEPLPRELQGPGGCTLCGALACGLEELAARRASTARAWWRGIRRFLGRAAAL